MVWVTDEADNITPERWGYLFERAKEKTMLDLKKGLFYVGSKDIASGRSDWPSTEGIAILKARELCAETRTPQIVVKIIALIEVKPPEVETKYLEETSVRRTDQGRARSPKRRVPKRRSRR